MNPQQLQLSDGTKLDAWRCEVCHTIYAEREPYSSKSCCTCDDCGCVIDPKVHGSRSHLCRTCWGPHYAKQDQQTLDQATELLNYEGPVCIGDKYWSSADECLGQLEGDRPDADIPEFVHACHVTPYSLGAECILQDMLENSDVEDADEHLLSGVKEFVAAVDAFNEANKGNAYWNPDGKHKVRLREPAVEKADVSP